MTDTTKIVFVTNGQSHRVAKSGSWLGSDVSTPPNIRILQFTNEAKLTSDLSDLANNGFSTIFIEGGDGTVLAVLSAAHTLASQFQDAPTFAILPGGSTNLAFKLLGFRARSARAFRRRLEGLSTRASGEVVHQRALCITSPSLSMPQLGFVLSTGTLARAMRYVQTEFHGPGHRGSFAVGQAILRFLKAPHAYLDHDGDPVVRGSQIMLEAQNLNYDTPHCLALMTSLPRLSLGLNPFWGKGKGGIALTYGAWPMPRFRRALLQALFWKRPQRLQKLGFRSHRLDELWFQSDAPIMIDGESHTIPFDKKITVTLSDPIRFLR